MKRRLWLALALGALMGALLPGIATATQSDTVASCKDGGWQQLVREDGSPFKNQGACVSYAARGGTPIAPDQDPLRAVCGELPASVYTRSVRPDGLSWRSACDTNLDFDSQKLFFETRWAPVCQAQPTWFELGGEDDIFICTIAFPV